MGIRLAPDPAGVGPGAGGGGPGGQHHHDEGDQRPGQPQRPAGHDQRAPPGPVAGLQGQDHGHGQQGHAHHEVGHDHVGVELGVHHEGADHRLAQDPHDEAGREPAQVAPGRPAEERGHHGHGAGDHQQRDHQPVAELDDRVEAERRGQVVLGAGGPVGAAQPGIGQPDRGPGDHVEDHHGQGDPAEEEEAAGADTQGGHRLLMVPAPLGPLPGPPAGRKAAGQPKGHVPAFELLCAEWRFLRWFCPGVCRSRRRSAPTWR